MVVALTRNASSVQPNRWQRNESLYFERFSATILTGEFLVHGNGSVGRFLDHCKFQDIPLRERPVIDLLPHATSKWLLLQVYSLPAECPDIAVKAPQDNSIVELKEWVANNVLIWIPQSSVKWIFFMFHHLEVTSKRYFPHGIAISGYTRRRRVRSGVVEAVSLEQHETFVKGCVTFSQRMFKFIVRLREDVCKVLSSKKLFMYQNKSILLSHVTWDCWSFLDRWMLDATSSFPSPLVRAIRATQRRVKVMLPSLAITKTTLKTVTSCVRIVAQEELVALRSILGWNFGVGTKKAAPRVGDTEQCAPLLISDQVRFVSCPENPGYNRNARFVYRVNDRGIDLCYDKENESLSIRIRFCECNAGHSDVLPFVRFANFTEENQSAEDGQHEELVFIGDLLFNRLTNTVHKVISVNGESVQVRQIGGANNNVESIMSLAEAEGLALSSIS